MEYLKKNYSQEGNISKIAIVDETTKQVSDFYKANPFPNYKSDDNKATILEKGNKNPLASQVKKFIGYGVVSRIERIIEFDQKRREYFPNYVFDFTVLGLEEENEINKKEHNNEDIVLEIKDSSYYSFDESRILAIEEVEKRLKENFFTNAINRINFSLINLLNESI